MSTKTVHFTIGEDFGAMITNIAQEHVLYEFDVEKGMKTITDSLIGVDDKTAFKILIGQLSLSVDVESQELSANPNTSGKGKIYFKNLYEKLQKVNRDAYELEQNFKNVITRVKRTSINITAETLNDVLNDNFEGIKEILNTDFASFVDYKDATRKFCAENLKKMKMYRTLRELGAFYYVGHDFGFNFQNMEVFGLEYGDKFDSLCNLVTSQSYALVEEEDEEEIDELNNYIKSAMEIDKTVKKGIEPVDHKKGWNAGWIAPNGDYYALNGEIANMLHLNIADALVSAKIIPEDFGGWTNADSFLERDGWVKQHDNWILFDGYNNDMVGAKDKVITEAQRKVIYEIGQMCHKGILKLGFRREMVSAVRFQAMDNPMLRMKYFNY